MVNDTPLIDDWGDHVCTHGVALDMHCCDCKRRGFFPPEHCDCYNDGSDDDGEEIEEAA